MKQLLKSLQSLKMLQKSILQEKFLDTAEEFYRENGENDSAKLAKDFAKKFRDFLDKFDGGIEEKKRPDYPDVDGDGDTKEPMEKALKDKEKDEKKRLNVIVGNNQTRINVLINCIFEKKEIFLIFSNHNQIFFRKVIWSDKNFLLFFLNHFYMSLR